MRASDTTTIRRLDQEWEVLRRSTRLARRLRRWATEDPVLGFTTVDDLVHAARDRSVGDLYVRDRPLASLAARAAAGDRCAGRVALQIWLPQAVRLVDAIPFGEADDRAACVIAVTYDRIRALGPEPCPGAASWRLYRDVRRRVLRLAERHRSRVRQEASADPDDRVWAMASTPLRTGRCELLELAELVRWAADTAEVDDDVARLIVLSRAAGIPVSSLPGGERAQTARRRRLRAERRLRHRLIEAAA